MTCSRRSIRCMRITGGVFTKIRWHGKFWSFWALETSSYGGVLINGPWVLTTCHCKLRWPSSLLSFKISPSLHSAAAGTGLWPTVMRKAAKIIVHLGFDYAAYSVKNDIALIMLDYPEKFNDCIWRLYIQFIDLLIALANSKDIRCKYGYFSGWESLSCKYMYSIWYIVYLYSNLNTIARIFCAN